MEHKHRFLLPSLLVLASVLLATSSAAQTVLYKLEGSLGPTNDLFGEVVVGLDDVDADGTRDILVTAPARYDSSGKQTGAAVIHSGATGQIIRTHHGEIDGDRIGNSALDTGDLDGDGVGDYAIGAMETDFGAATGGSIYYYSGASGALIRRVDGTVYMGSLGASLTSLGDVNGDGIPDQAAGGGRSQTGTGYFCVISGGDGSTLFTQFEPYPYTTEYSVRVAGIGDVNGDSIGDLAVGSRGSNANGGDVRIVSGSDGALIRQLSTQGGEFGTCVAAAGDVDGDGVGDLLVGAPRVASVGYAYVFSGADGSILRTFVGENYDDLFGTQAIRCGDMDGDGIAEYAISAENADHASTDSGRVRVFSGQSGAVLYSFDGDGHGANLGNSLAALGDVNSDGVADLAAAQWKHQPGSVKVFSGTCSSPQGVTYCVGMPNSAGPGASIGFAGSPSISAGTFSLTVTGCPPSKYGIFIYASDEAQAPWGNGVRCVTGDYLRRIRPGVLTSAQGSATLLLNFSTPPTDFLPGANPKFQFYYRDPPAGGARFNASNALSMSFCP